MTLLPRESILPPSGLGPKVCVCCIPSKEEPNLAEGIERFFEDGVSRVKMFGFVGEAFLKL